MATCSSFFATSPALNAAIPTTCLKCVDYGTTYYNSGTCTTRTQTSVASCSTYSETADACAACNAGNTFSSGTCTAVTVTANPADPTIIANPYKTFLSNVGGYLDTCSTTIPNCDANTFYENLNAPASTLFSCHKCTGGTYRIPFVFLHAGNSTYSGPISLSSYGLNATITSTDFYGFYDGGTSIQCLDVAATSFHATFLNGKFNFPTNCALGLYNIWSAFDASSSNQATNVDKTKIAAICLACQPGYKSAGATDTSSAVVPAMVSSCTAISNCLSSTAFNACSVCASTYAFQYSVANDVDFTACVSTTLANCMIVQSVNSVLVCMLCSLGYYVNFDGICETLQTPNCNANGQYEKNLNGVKILKP